jgi:hypothetical protein
LPKITLGEKIDDAAREAEKDADVYCVILEFVVGKGWDYSSLGGLVTGGLHRDPTTQTSIEVSKPTFAVAIFFRAHREFVQLLLSAHRRHP